MGILLGALAGGAEASLRKDEIENRSMLDRDTQLAVGQQRSDLELQRQQTLEKFKMSLGEQQRTAQVGRIDEAAGKIAEPAIAQKRGIIQGGIADPTAWTPEQQAAVDQSLAGDKQQAMADPKTRTQAAIATGDIDPKSAAVLGQKDDSLMYKTLYEQSREDGRNARLDATEEGRFNRQQAALDAREKLAEIKAQGGGNVSREERMRYTSLLGDAGRRLGEAEKALSTLQKDMFSKNPDAQRTQELDDLRATVKTYREEHKLYQSLLAGSQAPDGDTKKPGAATSKSAPYPEGTRLTGPGGKPYIVKNGIPVPQ